jgi:hypothetical protein
MTTPAKGDEAPKSQVPNTQSTKPVAAAATTIPDPDAKKPEPKEEPTPELSKEEEKKLEALLGGHSEVEDDDDEAPLPAGVAHPMVAVAAKLRKLVTHIPKDTPDEFQIWGAAGITLTLGDLRTVVKQLR